MLPGLQHTLAHPLSEGEPVNRSPAPPVKREEKNVCETNTSGANHTRSLERKAEVTAFVDDNACDPQGTCILFMEITGPENSKRRLASQQEEVI